MKKFNKKCIPSIAARYFLPTFIILNVFLDFLNEFEVSKTIILIYIIATVVLSIIFPLIYAYLFVRFSEYEFQEKGIFVKRGVFVRKQSFVEYGNIHAINKRQGLVEKACDTSRLMIDSGSTNTASRAEIIIYELDAEVDRLMNLLRARESGKEELKDSPIICDDDRVSLIDFTPRLKVFNALLDILSIAVFGILLLLLYGVSQILIGLIAESAGPLFILFIILGTIFAFTLSIVIIGKIILVLVHYHDFKVFKNNDDLEITYGLFTTFHHTFNLKKIKAVIIKQTLLYRIFGYASIMIEVIGYSEDNSDKSTQDKYLIPTCKFKDCQDIISKTIGDFPIIEKEYKSKSYSSFILWPIFKISVVFLFLGSFITIIMHSFNLIEYAFVVLGVLLFLYVLFVTVKMINKYVQYKFEGCGITDDKLTIYQGGFTRYITTIADKHIIGLTEKTTPLREKKSITSYSIHIKTNDVTNEYHIEMMDTNLRDKLVSKVRV